jgi:hypothetical protein
MLEKLESTRLIKLQNVAIRFGAIMHALAGLHFKWPTQGCLIFLAATYQNGDKYTRRQENTPNGHKVQQMSIKIHIPNGHKIQKKSVNIQH